MKEIRDKEEESKGRRCEFTRIVELPVEPKHEDYINVIPCGFTWGSKTIDTIEGNDNDQDGKVYFKANRSGTLVLREDKSTLKESIEYLLSSYKKCGWKLEYIPEFWQKIIDKKDG